MEISLGHQKAMLGTIATTWLLLGSFTPSRSLFEKALFGWVLLLIFGMISKPDIHKVIFFVFLTFNLKWLLSIKVICL